MRWLGALAAVAVLGATAPGPLEAARALGHPTSADPFAPIAAAASLAAWALSGWLLLVVVAAVAGQAPGALGRVAGRVSRRLTPSAVRRALELTLGLTVATGALSTPPASAAVIPPPPAPPATEQLVLDWPGTPSASGLDWPAAPVPATARAADHQDVVVRPGDTLWAIAADHLRTPTPAAVARSWPRWWSANRAVIGSDPDLIQPGTSLVPPSEPPTR